VNIEQSSEKVNAERGKLAYVRLTSWCGKRYYKLGKSAAWESLCDSSAEVHRNIFLQFLWSHRWRRQNQHP